MATSCVACGSGKKGKLHAKSSFLGYPTYRCGGCGMYFFYCGDRDAEKRCAEYYSSAYWGTVRKKWDDRRKLLNPVITALRWLGTEPLQQLWHFRIIARHAPPGKGRMLLDIGCGRGDFMRFFTGRGYEVEGIEPDTANAEAVNRRFGRQACINGIVEKVPLKKRYDVVYLCHVFEHLIRPDIFLRKLKKNLTKEGVIFIEVPNCSNKSILDNSIWKHPHLYSFTQESLRRLFTAQGYGILEIGTYSEVQKNLPAMLLRMLLKQNNYRKDSPENGERIIVLARKK